MSAQRTVVAIAGGRAFTLATLERGKVATSCGHEHATYALAAACTGKLAAPKPATP